MWRSSEREGIPFAGYSETASTLTKPSVVAASLVFIAVTLGLVGRHHGQLETTTLVMTGTRAAPRPVGLAQPMRSPVHTGTAVPSFASYPTAQRPTARALPRMQAASGDAEEDRASMNIIICGAGIIGASIAYYLTLKGYKPTVVERKEVAAAAGGKGGGFLAGGWGYGVTEQLHTKSFQLHEELARDLKIESYRKLPVLSVCAGSRPNPSKVCSWLDGSIATSRVMDPDTAQVTPKEYTTALMNAAIEKGAKLVIGKVEGMETLDADGNRKVTAVLVDGQEMPADKVVIAMGPWSVHATDWLGLPVPMQGIWSTSVVYNHEGAKRSNEQPNAMFCEEDGNGCHLEVYPRPNGEIYLCGIGGSKYMNPEDIKKLAPEDVVPDPKRVAAAHRSFSNMTTIGQEVDTPGITQACMRPCLTDAMPMMGLVPDTDNAYIACGHNCWGILWAPISGLAMAELIADGESTTVDLFPFRPERFGRPKASKKARGRAQGTENVGEQW